MLKGFDGRVAAVTGAGSGIGRALATELARRGTHLALADIDAEGLAETARRCAGPGVRVTTAVVDVADCDAVHAWADAVVADHGRVNLVVNNAGVTAFGTVAELGYDDLAWVMDVDFWGVVHGTKAFLPHLEASGEGHVVNVSSVFGLIGIPGQSAYNAAKFAVRGFTEALRMELEIAGSAVSATCVHPGGVDTAIVRRARSVAPMGPSDHADAERLLRASPDEVARHVLDAVARNRRRTLPGSGALLFDVASRLPAGVVQRLVVAGGRRRRTP